MAPALLAGLATAAVLVAALGTGGALTPPQARDLPAPLPPALPLVPGLNSDFLDGLDAADFAAAGHDHDGRYYTEAESDARFAAAGHDHDGRYLPLGGKAADADRVDGRDSRELGPLSTLRATAGKVLEWTYSGYYTHEAIFGAGGNVGINPQPWIRVGRTDAPAPGFLPPGTTFTVGVTEQLLSKATCCTANTGLAILTGPVTLLKYSLGDAAQPGELRVRYVQESGGAQVEEDWASYADGEVAYLEVAYTVRGDSISANNRVVDLTLTKGAEVKTITGVRVSGASIVLQGLPASNTVTNGNHVFAAAGRLAFP